MPGLAKPIRRTQNHPQGGNLRRIVTGQALNQVGVAGALLDRQSNVVLERANSLG